LQNFIKNTHLRIYIYPRDTILFPAKGDVCVAEELVRQVSSW